MRGRLSALRGLATGSVVPFLAVLIEVLWVHAWLTWASGWQSVHWDRPPLGILGSVTIAMTAQVVTRVALAGTASLTRVRVAAVALMGVVVALVVRVELGGGYAIWDPDWGRYAVEHPALVAVGLIAGAYFLWRGIVVGRESLSFDTLYPRFLFGLTALVLLLVVWGFTVQASEFRRILAVPSLYVVAYFTTGLLALALANFQSISQEMRRGDGAVLLPRRWLALFIGVLAMIVVLSVAIASAFSFELVLLLTRPLNTLADWLFTGFQYVVPLPLGLLAEILIYVLRFLMNLLSRGKPPEPFNPSDASDWRKALEGKSPQVISPDVLLALKWGLVALAVGGVCVLLARALFRYRHDREEGEAEETSESLWSWDVFKADLRAFLLRLVSRFRRGAAADRRAARPPVAVTEVSGAHLLSVRDIYRGLLWEGRKAGTPRRDSETPNEYAGALRRHLTGGTAELQAITDAYMTERYGGKETSPEDRGTIKRLWRRLHAVFNPGRTVA